jgi:hypothetical protein
LPAKAALSIALVFGSLSLASQLLPFFWRATVDVANACKKMAAVAPSPSIHHEIFKAIACP